MNLTEVIIICCLFLVAAEMGLALDEHDNENPDKRAATCTGKADIVFLVDSSGSVGEANFNSTLRFIKNVVSRFDIGYNTVRIGVDTFSSSFRREFSLRSYSSKYSINYAIDRIRYRGGGTDTASAISNMTSGSFSSRAGHRSGVRKIAVVITDGRSSSSSLTLAAARRAKSAGIYMMAVGVGSNIDVTELNGIASSPASRYVWRSPSYSALYRLQSLLPTRMCPVMTPPSRVTCTSRRADVVFLLDNSGSVGSSNFNRTLRFVKDVVSRFTIGSNAIRVGVDTFSNGFRQEVLLRSASSSSFPGLVDKIRYDGGGSYTGLGLTGISAVSFSTMAGRRSGVPRIGIVVTDGQSSSTSDTSAAALRARNAGIYLLVVGVGPSASSTELNSIATDPDSQNVFKASSYTSLSSLQSSLAARICSRASYSGKREIVPDKEIPKEHLE